MKLMKRPWPVWITWKGTPGCYTRKMVNVTVFKGDDGEPENSFTAWLYFFPERQGALVKSGVFHRSEPL